MKKLILLIIFFSLGTGVIHADDYDLIIDHGSVMLIIDPDTGDIVFANYAASRFYGWSIEELQGRNIYDINTLDNAEIEKKISLAKEQENNYFNFIHRVSDGSFRNVEVYSYPIIYENKEMLFSIIIDVTEKLSVEKELTIENEHKKESLIDIIYVILIVLVVFIVMMGFIFNSNRKLKYLSTYDPLTQVFNRVKARESYIKLMDKHKLPIAFFMIDVNNLKFINDTYGHIIGDEMIVKISNELKILAGEKGIVSRVSGDEFVVLMSKVVEDEVCEIEGKIRKTHIPLKGIHFDASVGMLIINDNMSYDEAFSTAERKMYTTKAHNRSINNERIERELMNKLKQKMPDINNQIEFVQKTVTYLGHKVELTNEEINDLVEAAKVQDIGLSIIDNIDEMMFDHPEKGYSVLNALGKTYTVTNTVFHHHENYNGSGYPKGLKGMEIPLSSRILSIANWLYFELNHKSVSAVVASLNSHSDEIFDPNLIEIIQNNSMEDFVNQILNNQA